MEWTYISDKKPKENFDYWVSCFVNGDHRTHYVCLAYLNNGVWYFSNDTIGYWRHEELKEFGWIPYAYQEYVVPEPAELRKECHDK